MRRHVLILAVLAMAATSTRAGDEGIKQSIAYVQKLQTASGGFRSYQAKEEKLMPTLRATSGAIRALKYLGGDLPRKEACIKFVESCWDAEAGGFSDTPKGKADVFSTAVGLMAVVELKMPTEKYADAASKYLNEHAKTFEEIRIAAAGFEAIKKRVLNADWWKDVDALQRKDPSFDRGKARDRASRDVTILRLGAKLDPPDASLPELDNGQRQNGGWGKDDKEKASDLETTYRVMRCYVMLKVKPGNVEGVRSFVAKCRNADGGYAIAPGQPSSVSGTYFAAIITHWLKER